MQSSQQSYMQSRRAWRVVLAVPYAPLLAPAGLSGELTEQLRLILEPTKATRLAGEFRSGKRLAMRKVIAYIASHFRKDKIWLRRTRPDQRTYQVRLARGRFPHQESCLCQTGTSSVSIMHVTSLVAWSSACVVVIGRTQAGIGGA